MEYTYTFKTYGVEANSHYSYIVRIWFSEHLHPRIPSTVGIYSEYARENVHARNYSEVLENCDLINQIL
jgi:hypothetical protein